MDMMVENKLESLYLDYASTPWMRVEGPALEVFKKTHTKLNFRQLAEVVLYRRWIEDQEYGYEDEVQEVLVLCKGGGRSFGYQSWWERQPDGHWVEDGPENFF